MAYTPAIYVVNVLEAYYPVVATKLWIWVTVFKAEETDQIANIRWIIEKAEYQKSIYFTDYVKAYDCVDHNKLWKILQEMGIPDRLTCLLRNLYAGQKATVRTRHGITDWFQIR